MAGSATEAGDTGPFRHWLAALETSHPEGPVVSACRRMLALGWRAELDPVGATELAGTAEVLGGLGLGDEPIVACVLVTALRAGIPEDALLQGASEELRTLVEGQQAARKVWDIHAARGEGGGHEGLRRLLLVMVRDLRVVFILLARQLVRMRAAVNAPPAERERLARITADMHAPLANRLGVWQLKWELEDLAFRFLQPETYRRIARLLDERRDDREAWIRQTCSTLTAALADAGIRAEVAGRPKHIYSIWRKMQRKHLEFSDLHDLRAVRIMVEDVAACYAALGIVHTLWVPVPGEFDDYIARPKGNQYQSLHTGVIGPGGRTLEVQIRSHQMHRHAELGVAAHWRYKEGGQGDAGFERKIAWLRQLLDAREAGDDDSALLAGLRTEVIEDRVYLLTPRGEVLDLPQGATVLDFAYSIHTDVGHRCRGAKVNGRIVPLTFQPRTGDRIEILTGKTLEPRRDWLSSPHGYLATHRARSKVRAWFKRLDRAQNQAAGKAVLERELKRLALQPATLEGLPERFGRRTLDELLEALAFGDVTTGHLARALHQLAAPAQVPQQEQGGATLPAAQAPVDTGAIIIEGVGNLLTQLARCCQPLPGDEVAGYITRGRGITVHRRGCGQLLRLQERDPSRVVAVEWGEAGRRMYEVDILVRGYDRAALHKDISTTIAAASARVVGLRARTDARQGILECRYALRVNDFGHLSGLLGQLAAIANVIEARRLA